MYSWEIQEYLKNRGYYVGGDDLLEVTSNIQNPQLNHIKYNPETREYKMWDKEGIYFKFKAMPYEEAIQKGLVKNKEEEEQER